jgi:hypothetical protein
MKACLAVILAAAAISACAARRVETSLQPDPLSHSVEFEYRRLHSAAGKFLTADLLEANRDLPLLQVLSTHVLGFPLTGDGRPTPGLPTGCSLQVFVNGLPSFDTLNMIRPHDLLGVEYYRAATAPLKYQRAFSDCPVLLLWLRP